MHFGSMDSKPYVKLAKGCLVLPSSVTEFNEVCIHNSSQNQLCTYKTSYSKTRLRNSVHNSRKNQLYINLPSSREQLGLRVFTHCVSYALIFNHT